MAIYNIVFENDQKYSACIYSASYINPINYLEDISDELKTHQLSDGYVLFDLMLSNGNSFNRFAEAFFDGNQIKRETINVVELADTHLKERADAHYKGRTEELKNSVLTSFEKTKYGYN